MKIEAEQVPCRFQRRHSRGHTAKVLELSTDLPVVIEIVDAEERIRAFSPTIAEVITEGMVTLETMRVLKYVSLDAAHR